MKKLSILIFFSILFSCDKNEELVIQSGNNINISGTGSFIFSQYPLTSNKTVEVFYHLPPQISNSTPILFVIHGADRNASQSRDVLINEANQKGFIIISPEFNSVYFPGGDAFNLANIFVDGDNPTPQTLNNKENWTTSIIDPLFDLFSSSIGNTNLNYDLIGFSAGGQFAHRFLIFNQSQKCNRIIAISSGWYTTLDESTSFPYGVKDSPLDISSVTNLLSKELTILIGENDNDPNDSGLRRNSIVDQQGVNRFTRANYFYNLAENKSIEIGCSFNWSFATLPNVGHQLSPLAVYATEILY